MTHTSLDGNLARVLHHDNRNMHHDRTLRFSHHHCVPQDEQPGKDFCVGGGCDFRGDGSRKTSPIPAMKALPITILFVLMTMLTACSKPDPATIDLPDDLFVGIDKHPHDHDPTLMPPDPDCPIKGNVNTKGETTKYVYHMPEDNFYYLIKIDTTDGDQWFCSEEQAQAAGFLRSYK